MIDAVNLTFLLPALAGCIHSERAFGVHPDMKSAADATTVDLLALTTREQINKNRACAFSGERGHTQAICNFIVSIPPDDKRKIGQIQWPTGSNIDPGRDFVTLKAQTIEDRYLDSWFRNVAGGKRRLLVFVHGFNTNFDEGVYRLAQIIHDSGMDAAPVLFSWPSRGRALSYVYDNASAAYSRDALAYLITRSIADPNVSDITIMAHSLGGWLTMDALRQIAIRDGSVSPKVSDIILASPDIDIDVFRSQLIAMGDRPPRTTIFISRDDNALALSRIFAGGVDRVGAVNPALPKYASQLERFNIQVIDLTKVQSGDSLHHSKFATSPEIVQLIGKRLIAGQPIDAGPIVRLSG